MNKEYPQMKVSSIDRQQGRTLLYGEGQKESRFSYHVIAEERVEVGVGDTVQYESGGANFGWFVQVLTKAK